MGKHGHSIQFPIFQTRPRDKKSITSYEQKIKGITDPIVCASIEMLQPYYAPNPLEHPLFVLNKMDITDKHKELVLCITTAGASIPTRIGNEFRIRYQQGQISESDFRRKMRGYSTLVLTISLADSPQDNPKALLPTLTDLHNFVVCVVQQFSCYLLPITSRQTGGPELVLSNSGFCVYQIESKSA